VDGIVDKTGAGDLYAAGFLFGLARRAPLVRCAEFGSLAAGEVIGHIGARPQASLKELAEQANLAC
jgi:sugar/nucleoside kinase (ribokinase family)